MNAVLTVHSIVRFLVLLVALIGLVKTLVSMIRKSPPEPLDQTLASVFLGSYDLQLLLGILIILLGGLSQAVHPIVMGIGLLVAHGLAGYTRRAAGPRTLVLRLALYVVPLAFILTGLAAINRLPV